MSAPTPALEALPREKPVRTLKPWTRKEEQWLRTHHTPGSRASLLRCAAVLNRPVQSVKKKALRLRLVTRPEWTPEEDDHLRDNYPHDGAAVVGAELGRSVEGVRQRAQLLKVRYAPQTLPLRAAKAMHRRGHCDTHIGAAVYRGPWWFRPYREAWGRPANGRKDCPGCKEKRKRRLSSPPGHNEQRDTTGGRPQGDRP